MKALVIDDSAVLRKVFTHMLSRNGFDVIQADNGAAGLAALMPRIDEIGVVLISFDIPGMPALEFVEAMHTSGSFTRPKIIVLTSATQPIDTASWLMAGVDDLVSKSCTDRTLLRSLQFMDLCQDSSLICGAQI